MLSLFKTNNLLMIWINCIKHRTNKNRFCQ